MTIKQLKQIAFKLNGTGRPVQICPESIIRFIVLYEAARSIDFANKGLYKLENALASLEREFENE